MHSHIKEPNYCYQKESAKQGCLWAKDSFMELISSIRHKNIYDVVKLVKTEGVFSAVQVLFGPQTTCMALKFSQVVYVVANCVIPREFTVLPGFIQCSENSL